MTIWTPDLSAHQGPLYQRLAQAITAAVADGTLPPGCRLPAQRDLAWRLGVTVGTITRGYGEARRLGVLSGEVGRGTFVRGEAAPDLDAPHMPPADQISVASQYAESVIDLSFNVTPASPVRGPFTELLRRTAQQSDPRQIDQLLHYLPDGGALAHRQAGAAWMARAGLDVDPAEVVVANGVQNALTATLATLANPGDTIACEATTYPGVLGVARLLHLKVVSIETNQHGLCPRALDALARRFHPKVLVTIPSFHNPTASYMPAERREEVVALCRRHGMMIVEDDIYGFLAERPAPPLARLAPDITVFLTGTAKVMSGGLRVGFLRGPSGLTSRLATNVRLSGWMAPPIGIELAARMLEPANLEPLLHWHRQEALTRQRMASDILGTPPPVPGRACYHLWLPVPEGAQPGRLIGALRRRGVTVTDPHVFDARGLEPPPPYLRLCLGATDNREAVRQGLEKVADALALDPADPLPAAVI
ncbi:PLP-dependent aminotransferase family protein [Roseospirillum parvum]|nr:PLP-dependent aminotransferase family protein [Roseospirillum parvum]